MIPEWFESIWGLLLGETPARRPLFRRRMRLSGPVVAWLRDPQRTDAERWALADLLLRLDSDPFTHSAAILNPGTPPGLRWAPLGDGRKVIIKFDPIEDRVSVVSITAPRG